MSAVHIPMLAKPTIIHNAMFQPETLRSAITLLVHHLGHPAPMLVPGQTDCRHGRLNRLWLTIRRDRKGSPRNPSGSSLVQWTYSHSKPEETVSSATLASSAVSCAMASRVVVSSELGPASTPAEVGRSTPSPLPRNCSGQGTFRGSVAPGTNAGDKGLRREVDEGVIGVVGDCVYPEVCVEDEA